ncbi:5'-nucleotidase, lipoprotein e(P4) family [Phaeocystidibacter luteus]|nr:5'-nucleotidase, lipoprotein e(P4) family [Phaeocystidibacter luteus]
MIIHTDKTTMLKHLRFASIILASSVLIACGGEAGTQSSGDMPTNSVELSPTQVLANQSMDAVLWFNTSAEANYIYRQTYALAQMKLEENLESAEPGHPYAVVLDIDETVLDNSPYQVQLLKDGATFSNGSWTEWVRAEQAKALPGALGFTLFCESRGIEVFYISNRSNEFLKSTLNNLAKEGFPFTDEDHILLMDGPESDKTDRRMRVAGAYQILLYCGDNLRDYKEDFSARDRDFGKDYVQQMEADLQRNFILFPNPMYGEWTRFYVRDEPTAEMEAKRGAVDRILETMGE